MKGRKAGLGTGPAHLLVLVSLVLFSGLACASSVLPGNRLKDNPSPYLALHGEDPVAWQTWSAETLALARRSGRLLFVSVGYFACHWCHVMHRESYRNPRIAAYLNAHFIPVKIDRELNSGLDEALQGFAANVIHQGGWPLNVFVTPQGYPLTAVLYQPPTDFLHTLTRVQERWSEEPANLASLARTAVSPVRPLSGAGYGAEERRALLDAFLIQARTEADSLAGGFGEVAKFPHVPQLSLLLNRQSTSPDPVTGSWLRLTLNAMASRALRDHVYGGFFRYTTDPGWTVPHFEKMLYDNAQLAMFYLRAADILHDLRYEKVARSTLDFLLEFLRDPASGAFYSSTSAVDRRGKEGVAYLWSREALQARLSPQQMKLARRIWHLDQPSPFDSGQYLPAEYEPPGVDDEALLESAYGSLKTARANQDIPRDTKMLTGLNGLALSAFSRAGKLDIRYRKAAAGLYRFMRGQWRDGRLQKGQSGRQALRGAELEDYAYGAAGLLDFAEAFKDERARKLAYSWVKRGWQDFSTSAGWMRERAPLLKSMQPRAVLEDGALPSPAAVLIDASLRLKAPELAWQAGRALGWRSAAMERDPFAYPTQITLLNGGCPGCENPTASGITDSAHPAPPEQRGAGARP
ncbi:MAG TPA: DUF255 domain-containing protein [Thiobacillaceae bacterium]|nr:DUF255 domain-containing protein [Thiobacillaceae bacterium]